MDRQADRREKNDTIQYIFCEPITIVYFVDKTKKREREQQQQQQEQSRRRRWQNRW